MRLLFITSSRIDEAVLSTGLLQHMIARAGAAGAPAEVTVVTGPEAAPLFGAVPGLKRLHLLRRRRYNRHWVDLWRRLVGTRWDVIVDARRTALPFTLWEGRLWTGRRLIARKPAADDHPVRRLGALVGRADDPPAPRLWMLQPHYDNAARLLPGDGPILALAPGADSPETLWPAERFAEAAARLTDQDGPLAGAQIAVFGGKDARLQAAPLLRAVPRDRRIDLVGRVDPLTAAACLRRARLFIGADSGLMHMAGAVGTPTVGLFGPAQNGSYPPWGAGATALRAPESGMGDLSVDRTVAAAQALIGQAPREGGRETVEQTGAQKRTDE